MKRTEMSQTYTCGTWQKEVKSYLFMSSHLSSVVNTFYGDCRFPELCPVPRYHLSPHVLRTECSPISLGDCKVILLGVGVDEGIAFPYLNHAQRAI